MVVEVKMRYFFDRLQFLNFQGLRNPMTGGVAHIWVPILAPKKPPNKLHSQFKRNEPIQKLEHHVRTHCQILWLQNTSYNFLHFIFFDVPKMISTLSLNVHGFNNLLRAFNLDWSGQRSAHSFTYKSAFLCCLPIIFLTTF